MKEVKNIKSDLNNLDIFEGGTRWSLAAYPMNNAWVVSLRVMKIKGDETTTGSRPYVSYTLFQG